MKPTVDPQALERRIRQKVQGVIHNFWVVCHPGFEKTIAHEIAGILGQDLTQMIRGPVGFEFQGKLEDCWKVHALARTPSRISMRLDRFRATQFPELVRKVEEIPWELYMSPFAEGQIQVTSRNSKLIHTDAIEERVAIGIQRRLEPWSKALPQISSPAQTVLVRFEQDECTISLDASGELLFKRGLHRYTEEAPLRDTLAACILRESGVDACQVIYDAMAGSGTFAWEAALGHTPQGQPGVLRHFAFENWPAFRPQAYAHLLKTLQAQNTTKAPLKIFSSDLSAKELRTIRENLVHLPSDAQAMVQVAQRDFFALKPQHTSEEKALVLLNPPYGIRIGQTENLYQRIGEKLRRDFAGARYAVLCASPEDLEDLQLPTRKRIMTKHGGLPVMIALGTVPFPTPKV